MIDDFYQGPMMTSPNEEGFVSFICTQGELIKFENFLTKALDNLSERQK